MGKSIDADAHVFETEQTWDYLEPKERHLRPISLTVKDASGSQSELWQIDGRFFRRRTNIGEGTEESSRELLDINLRLRHMDQLEVDVQVIYPSLFLSPVATRPEVEVALYRSYNKWMADIWRRGQGRLRWVVLAPTMSIPDAIDEMRWAKQNGACGLFLRGLEGDRRLSDPYFFPLYDEAARLDFPLCIHSANGSHAVYDYYHNETGMCKFKLTTLGAFHSLVNEAVPHRFPGLRLGMIECRASWIPFFVKDMNFRNRRDGKDSPEDFLTHWQFWVACQTDDDIAYLLNYASPERFIIGTDYGHADPAAELDALRRLRREGQVPASVIDKILMDNPAVFYGFNKE
jgi:predicted TIM-barrel fold metal-dependent hydrolase